MWPILPWLYRNGGLEVMTWDILLCLPCPLKIFLSGFSGFSSRNGGFHLIHSVFQPFQ
ncbi:hypothetical protein SLEP1_g58377 [Rubroshorea leprosula]|uniref:Uncharacterized protein n=1 Tax=Rubroshorea leprosula TaxID=152421 RepID=A0AAV5MQD2_9ROSI|nr:hypothetical protein SLEP1_g58377 [Rubroshorea leprosula]